MSILVQETDRPIPRSVRAFVAALHIMAWAPLTVTVTVTDSSLPGTVFDPDMHALPCYDGRAPVARGLSVESLA